MRLIGLVVVLALGVFARPLVGEAQQAGKVPRVGLLGTATPSLMAPWINAFRDGLRQHGYVEGQNVVIEYRWGEGKPDRFPGLVAELVRLKVDVIVTSGPHAIRAAQAGTSTIPIVMAVIDDPVEQGLVTSIGRPGGNLTGLSFQDSDLATKRVQLLREALPSVTRVAALWDSSSSGAPMKAMERAASSIGLVVHVLAIRRSSSWPRHSSLRTGRLSWP